jgi:hypothetical protein
MVRDTGLAILVPFARSRGELISCISARLAGRGGMAVPSCSPADYLIAICKTHGIGSDSFSFIE